MSRSAQRIRNLVVLAAAAVHSPARAHRLLWLAFCWVMVGVFMTLGGAYLVGGAHVSSRLVRQFLPGGMVTHGALMVALATALTYGIAAPMYGLPVVRPWARRALLAMCGYSVWFAFEFLVSGVLSHSWSIPALVWWTASSCFAVILVKLPPPSDGRISGGSDGRGRA